MRWTHPTPPKKGDTRTVTRFLWWPKRIGQETRWLENATWTETAQRFIEYAPGSIRYGLEPPTYWAWSPSCWGVE